MTFGKRSEILGLPSWHENVLAEQLGSVSTWNLITMAHRLMSILSMNRINVLRNGICQSAPVAILLVALLADRAWSTEPTSPFRLATFEADVTIPLGHPIIAGARMPAKMIVNPLTARGFVLLGGDKPLIIVSIEWCEIRNDAYDRWREILADAAGTDMQHVLVAATHVHDAPVVDLTAQKLLEQHHAIGSVCDLEFHERCVQRTAAALRKGLKHAQNITHIGMGEAKVERVASNRRYERANGTLSFQRTSMKSDPYAKVAAEGTIDPLLKTLSFWDDEQPVLALHTYAVHPMSYYGQGGVSDDFVGQARRRRQADDANVFQIYTSGCSGNITTGKYNDGSSENRAVLAGRVYDGMTAAWKNTKRIPLSQATFRCVPLQLEPRSDPGFSTTELLRTIKTGNRSADSEHKTVLAQGLAAMGLSWRQRVDAGKKIDLPAIDFGEAVLMLLPAESYVEYQLFAQRTCSEKFVVVMGYGECGPGYIPTDQAVEERDSNLDLWRWVEPPCERIMQQAIFSALQPDKEQR